MFFKKVSLLVLLIVSLSINAQIDAENLDNLVKETLQTFDVPGISVGIIKDGKIVYAKGHGVRSLTNKKEMNENTLVGVASNSKGFTCFALAMLVDAGKLNWDDKVRKHIPEFQLYDAWVTEQFTVRDLVTHRSGMSLGAGDLMFFPEGNDFTSKDVIIAISQSGETADTLAAIKLAKEMGPGKNIVTILCDHGKRYASKIFNKEFLKSKNLPIPKWL